MRDDLTDALRGGRDAGAASERAAARLAEAAEGRGLLDVAYATVDSPLGPLYAAGTARGLVMLAYGDIPLDERLERLARRVSPRILEAPARLDPVRRQLDEYFAGRRRRFDVPIDWSPLHGYTREVLRRTAEIPYGAGQQLRRDRRPGREPPRLARRGQRPGRQPDADRGPLPPRPRQLGRDRRLHRRPRPQALPARARGRRDRRRPAGGGGPAPGASSGRLGP